MKYDSGLEPIVVPPGPEIKEVDSKSSLLLGTEDAPAPAEFEFGPTERELPFLEVVIV